MSSERSTIHFGGKFAGTGGAGGAFNEAPDAQGKPEPAWVTQQYGYGGQYTYPPYSRPPPAFPAIPSHYPPPPKPSAYVHGNRYHELTMGWGDEDPYYGGYLPPPPYGGGGGYYPPQRAGWGGGYHGFGRGHAGWLAAAAGAPAYGAYQHHARKHDHDHDHDHGGHGGGGCGGCGHHGEFEHQQHTQVKHTFHHDGGNNEHQQGHLGAKPPVTVLEK